MRTFNNIYSLNLIRFIIDQISDAPARNHTVETAAERVNERARLAAATQRPKNSYLYKEFLLRASFGAAELSRGDGGVSCALTRRRRKSRDGDDDSRRARGTWVIVKPYTRVRAFDCSHTADKYLYMRISLRQQNTVLVALELSARSTLKAPIIYYIFLFVWLEYYDVCICMY